MSGATRDRMRFVYRVPREALRIGWILGFWALVLILVYGSALLYIGERERLPIVPVLVLCSPILLMILYGIWSSRVTVDVSPGRVRVGIGGFADPKETRVGEVERVTLRCRTANVKRGRSQTEVLALWGVTVKGATGAAVLPESEDAELEMRGIAERLARFFRAPVVLRVRGEQEITLACADLDLPFAERTRRFPQLAPESAAPEVAGIEVERTRGGVTYRWSAFTGRNLLRVAVFLPPLWLGSRYGSGLAFADFGAVRWAEWSKLGSPACSWLMILAGTILPFVLLALVRWRLEVGKDETRLTTLVLVPVMTRSLAHDRLEEIWTKGPAVVLLSDERELQMRFHDGDAVATAAWVADDLRRTLADR